MQLPPTAIGKDWRGTGRLLAPAPSGTGWQVSLFGLAGVTVAMREGLELNLLGLTIGIDILHPAVKLPGLGRLGLPLAPGETTGRSEERRVGTEGFSTCRSRGAPDPLKKNNIKK